jgi:hypothetical protein
MELSIAFAPHSRKQMRCVIAKKSIKDLMPYPERVSAPQKHGV